MLKPGHTHDYLVPGKSYEVHIQNNGSTFLADYDSRVPTEILESYEALTITLSTPLEEEIALIESEFYTLPEAAQRLNVSLQYMNRQVKREKYAFIFIFGIMVVHISVIDQMIQDRLEFKDKAAQNKTTREANRRCSDYITKKDLVIKANKLGIRTKSLSKLEVIEAIEAIENCVYVFMSIDELMLSDAPDAIFIRELDRRFQKDDLQDFIEDTLDYRPQQNVYKKNLIEILLNNRNNG